MRIELKDVKALLPHAGIGVGIGSLIGFMGTRVFTVAKPGSWIFYSALLNGASRVITHVALDQMAGHMKKTELEASRKFIYVANYVYALPFTYIVTRLVLGPVLSWKAIASLTLTNVVTNLALIVLSKRYPLVHLFDPIHQF